MKRLMQSILLLSFTTVLHASAKYETSSSLPVGDVFVKPTSLHISDQELFLPGRVESSPEKSISSSPGSTGERYLFVSDTRRAIGDPTASKQKRVENDNLEKNESSHSDVSDDSQDSAIASIDNTDVYDFQKVQRMVNRIDSVQSFSHPHATGAFFDAESLPENVKAEDAFVLDTDQEQHTNKDTKFMYFIHRLHNDGDDDALTVCSEDSCASDDELDGDPVSNGPDQTDESFLALAAQGEKELSLMVKASYALKKKVAISYSSLCAVYEQEKKDLQALGSLAKAELLDRRYIRLLSAIVDVEDQLLRLRSLPKFMTSYHCISDLIEQVELLDASAKKVRMNVDQISEVSNGLLLAASDYVEALDVFELSKLHVEEYQNEHRDAINSHIEALSQAHYVYISRIPINYEELLGVMLNFARSYDVYIKNRNYQLLFDWMEKFFPKFAGEIVSATVEEKINAAQKVVEIYMSHVSAIWSTVVVDTVKGIVASYVERECDLDKVLLDNIRIPKMQDRLEKVVGILKLAHHKKVTMAYAQNILKQYNTLLAEKNLLISQWKRLAK